jgi:hypothetical protein
MPPLKQTRQEGAHLAVDALSRDPVDQTWPAFSSAEQQVSTRRRVTV